MLEYGFHEWNKTKNQYEHQDDKYKVEYGNNSETLIECSNCGYELSQEEYESIWDDIN